MVIAIIATALLGYVLIQAIALPWSFYLAWKYGDKRWARKHPGEPNPGHILEGRSYITPDRTISTAGKARRMNRRTRRFR